MVCRSSRSMYGWTSPVPGGQGSDGRPARSGRAGSLASRAAESIRTPSTPRSNRKRSTSSCSRRTAGWSQLRSGCCGVNRCRYHSPPGTRVRVAAPLNWEGQSPGGSSPPAPRPGRPRDRPCRPRRRRRSCGRAHDAEDGPGHRQDHGSQGAQGARTVDGGGVEDLLRDGVEEPLQQEDAEGVRDGRQPDAPGRVEQVPPDERHVEHGEVLRYDEHGGRDHQGRQHRRRGRTWRPCSAGLRCCRRCTRRSRRCRCRGPRSSWPPPGPRPRSAAGCRG